MVAGRAGGGLCLWDCGEPDARHEKRVGRSFTDKLQGKRVTVRWPSYTTEAQVADLRHAEEIVSLACLPKPEDGKQQHQQREGKENRENRENGSHGGGEASGKSMMRDLASTGCRFRVLSLNRLGMALVWDVCDIPFADNLAQVSGADLGLRIGSRFKLVKSNVIDLAELTAAGSVAPSAMVGITSFAASRDELTTLAVGTSRGVVHKFNRFGTTPKPPRYFSPLAAGGGVGRSGASPVLGLDFSPHDPAALLTCHADGSICLYRTSQPSPVHKWVTGAGAILQVRWSPSNPKAFFSLSSDSELARWRVHGGHGNRDDAPAPAASFAPEETHRLGLTTGGATHPATSFALNHCPPFTGAQAQAQGQQVFLSAAYANGEAAVFIVSDNTD